MKLSLVRRKNETEDFLLSIIKNCETLIIQTHTKAQETLELKMTKPTETFHFNPPVKVKEDWMIEVVSLEVYSSIFKINTTNDKFKL